MTNDEKYLPTPEEIVEKCAEIRLGWSEEEHYRRRYGMLVDEARAAKSWRPPVIKTPREADALWQFG